MRAVLTKAGLIVLMALGSVMLWLGAPVGWLYVGSQVQAKSESDGFTPYLLVIGGHRGVGGDADQGAVCALAGLRPRQRPDEPVRVRMPWHRSMRGDDDHRPPRSVLDVVMVISVAIAVVAMTIWFFFFAGSSLPSGSA